MEVAVGHDALVEDWRLQSSRSSWPAHRSRLHCSCLHPEAVVVAAEVASEGASAVAVVEESNAGPCEANYAEGEATAGQDVVTAE